MYQLLSSLYFFYFHSVFHTFGLSRTFTAISSAGHFLFCVPVSTSCDVFLYLPSVIEEERIRVPTCRLRRHWSVLILDVVKLFQESLVQWRSFQIQISFRAFSACWWLLITQHGVWAFTQQRRFQAVLTPRYLFRRKNDRTWTRRTQITRIRVFVLNVKYKWNFPVTRHLIYCFSIVRM